MRRLIIPVACLALVLTTGTAFASATSLLTLDGSTVNILEDLDYEALIDKTASPTTLDKGDYLFGIYEISDVKTDPTTGVHLPGAESFTAVFMVKVDNKSGADGAWTWDFVPASKADWLSELGIAINSPTGTIGILYSDNVKDGGSTFIDPDDVGGIPASLATVNGSRLWEIGFAGVAGEFWQATGPKDALSYYVGGNANKLGYTANLDVTWDYGGGVTLLTHDYLLFGMGDHQVQVQGGGYASDPGNFPLSTNTTFYIVGTPEPASLALLGLGLLGTGALVYKRRRSA